MFDKELVRGTLPLIVLSLTARGDTYGYQLIKDLEAVSQGAFQLKEGTVYPILHALEAEGLLDTTWPQTAGRRRKYYRITAAGRAALASRTAEWQSLVNAMALVLEVK